MLMYEVDLRDRKTGRSVETIYSGDNHDKAYKIAREYNDKNVLNYNEEKFIFDYFDGTDGFIAYVYHVEDASELRGVGKF